LRDKYAVDNVALLPGMPAALDEQWWAQPPLELVHSHCFFFVCEECEDSVQTELLGN
jgi:hypothetical protein